MTRAPFSHRMTAAGRRAWRAYAPNSVRQSAQPLVRWALERRIDLALRGDAPQIAPGPLVVSGLLAEAKGVSEGARLSLAAFKLAGLAPLSHDLRPMLDRGAGGGLGLPVDRAGGVWFLHVNAPEAIQTLGRLDPASWRGRYRIGYWAYELPRVPSEWVRASNAFHEIWAPSQFVVSALRASGVSVPVRLMPHPVALASSAHVGDRKEFGISPDAFAVLALGDLHSSAERKNLIGAIDTFVRAFPQPDGQRLIVKVRNDRAHPVFLTRAKQAAKGRPDIRFLTEDLSVEDTRGLIASCDLVLSPHRSEGFGLTLAEAFLADVPALATNWSGNMGFMADLPELLIASTLEPVRDIYRLYRARGQKWAEPDLHDAATKLRALAASPDLRKRLAAAGRETVEALSLPWRREALMAMPLGKLIAM